MLYKQKKIRFSIEHNDIKMHLQEIRWVSVKYLYRTQDEKKVLGSCESGNKTLGSAK